MIEAKSTNEASEHVKKRAKTMRVRTLSPFSYLVIPTEKGKVVRVVHLDYDQDTKVVRIGCSAWDSGESCLANSYSMHCSHVEAAIRRLLINAKRSAAIEINGEAKRNRTVRKVARYLVSQVKELDLPGVEK